MQKRKTGMEESVERIKVLDDEKDIYEGGE